MKKTKTISVSIPEEHCQKLQVLADKSFRTRAGYIRRLIRVYLQYIEQHPEQKIK